jgi:hypothetical protein
VIWVGWRQQRTETLIAGAVLVVLAAVAIPVGVHMASVYTHEGLAACAGNPQPGSSCGLAIPSFQIRFTLLDILFTWSTLLPPIAALLFAAPFVLDLDGGTYRLLWTQSITRRRWIVTKLGLGIAATVLVAVLLSILATWLRAPLDHINGRLSSSTYDAEGLVPIAYALFALGVAVALGAVWRRTVPALLTAFVVYVVARAFVDGWLRQRLVDATTATWRIGGGGGPSDSTLNRALVIHQYISDKSGRALPGANEVCVRVAGALPHTHISAPCLLPNAHDYMTTVFIPASRFWELQATEFGIVAGIGALLVAAAGWWTYRRIA